MKLEVELQKSDKDKQLKELEQEYKERKNIAKDNKNLLLDVEKWYNLERTKILKGHQEKIVKEEQQYQDKLNSLRLITMKDGLDKELQALNYWYEEQKRTIRKKDIELLNTAKKQKENEIKLKYELESKEKADREKKHLEEQIQQAKENEIAILQARLDYEYTLARNYAKSTIQDKKQLSETLIAIELEELELRKELLEEQLNAIKNNSVLEASEKKLKEQELLTAITSTEEKILNIKINASDRAKELFQREAEFKKQMLKQIIADTGNLFGQLYARQQQSTRREIEVEKNKQKNIIETERRKRLEHAVTQQEKDRINQEYDARLQEMEERYRQRQKEAGVEMFYIQQHIAAVQALMSTYAAASNALKDIPAPYNIPFAAMITALGLANVAMIELQEPPAYARGGLIKGLGGPYDDANLIKVSNGEYVINADSTSRNINLLDAINNNREIRLPISAQSDSQLADEIRLFRLEQKELISKQIRAFSKPHKVKATIDKYDTSAIVAISEDIINRSKA